MTDAALTCQCCDSEHGVLFFDLKRGVLSLCKSCWLALCGHAAKALSKGTIQ